MADANEMEDITDVKNDDSKTEKRMEEMARTGELDVEFEEEPKPEEEQTPPEDKGNEQSPQKIVVGGKEYSPDELEAQLKKAQDIQNDENWKKANTLKAQELAKKEAEINSKYAELRTKVQGDDVLESFVNPISEIDQRLETLEKREAEIKQREADNEQIDLMVSDAEKRLGVKIDRSSDEFKEIAQMVAKENPLYLAYQAKGIKASVPKVLKPASDSSQPDADGYSAKELASMKVIAEKAGYTLKEYLKFR